MVWPPRKLEDFGELSKAELMLRDEVGSGLPVVVGEGVPPVNAPEELRIRASFIRYLALGGCRKCRPHENGLNIKGAFVVGDGQAGADKTGLDLEGCDVKMDMVFESCRFPDKIVIRGASSGFLSLSKSHLDGGLVGDGSEIVGDLDLQEVRAAKKVSLAGVKVRGDFLCDGAIFKTKADRRGNNATALVGEGLDVGGNVFLRKAEAVGEVNFLDAKIARNLECSGSIFSAVNVAKGKFGAAFVADRSVVGADVNFRSVKATGEVAFAGAKVGGAFDCDRAKFKASVAQPGKPVNALLADGINVGSNVFFRKMVATGGVGLLDAKIGRNLEFSGATLRAMRNAKGEFEPALSAERIVVGADLNLRSVKAAGEVAFAFAKIGGAFDCGGARFKASVAQLGKPVNALLADGIDVGSNAFFRNTEATGSVGLLDAKIGRNMEFTGGTLRAMRDAEGNFEPALLADRIVVGADLTFRPVKASGEVAFLGAKVGGTFDCSHAVFKVSVAKLGKPRNALLADGIEIGRNAFFRNTKATGGVGLLDATIGRNLEFTGAELNAERNAEGAFEPALSADRIAVGADVLLDQVTVKGSVSFASAKLGGDLYCTNAGFEPATDATGSSNSMLDLSAATITRGFYRAAGGEFGGVLDLQEAEIGHIVDDQDCWPATMDLALDQCRYGAFSFRAPVDAKSRLDWLSRQDLSRWGEDFRPQPYEQCAKVLREMGHPADAREVLIK